MKDRTKIGAAASVAVAGVALVAGATGALTANADTPSATPSASSSASAGAQQGPQGGHGQHTAATAAETTSVKAAIKAKDSAVSVTSVEKDADGSFDAQGTKNGQPVHVEVSKDLKTVTVQTGGFGGHGQQGTAASASETTSVKAAVKAKDSSVTVENVMKESDGSFHAFGTKGSTRVRIEVSKDLKTVTITTDNGPQGGQQGQAPSGTPSSSSSQPA